MRERIAELEAENTKWLRIAQEFERENEELREALKDAIDGYEECAQYKGDYLFNKHGDAEDIARLKAALEEKGDE